MANQKLTNLPAATDIADTDLLYVVDDVGGTPTSKKVTGANVKAAAAQTVADSGAYATPAYVDSVASDVKSETRYAPVAHFPLDIPTYDDNPSISHLDVVLFDTPWNGWRYWMAFAPYPAEARENPSIVVSNDGVNWQVPTGLANPLFDSADFSDIGFFSDPDLVYDPDGDQLVLYFRGTSRVYRSVSSDGVTWTGTSATSAAGLQLVVDSSNDAEVLSPAVVRDDDGSWTMWSVNATTTPNRLEKRTSADGITWSAASVPTTPAGVTFWHIDAARAADEYHLLVNTADAGNGDRLSYLRSPDGDAWSGSIEYAVDLTRYDLDARHYRSTFVPVPGDPLRWDVWVNTISQDYLDASGTALEKGQAHPWRAFLLRGVSLQDDPKLTVPALRALRGTDLVPVFDSFDRPDAGVLGRADSGQTWVESTQITLASGRALLDVSTATTVRAWANASTKNMLVESWQRRTLDGWMGVAARVADETNVDGDQILVRTRRIGLSQEIELLGRASGTQSTLASQSGHDDEIALGVWCKIGLLVVGGKAVVFLNDRPILTHALSSTFADMTGTWGGIRWTGGNAGAGQKIEAQTVTVRAL